MRTGRWLLGWTALTLTFVWLPIVRGLLDGRTYSWQLAPGVQGTGVGGAYPLLLVYLVVGVTALLSGWRGNARLARILLPTWHLPLAMAGGWLVFASQEGLMLRGDTLGFSVDLSWFGAVLLVVPFLAALWWAFGDGHVAGTTAVWTSTDRRLLIVAITLLPLQLVLLRAGEPHGASDQIGVLLTIMQWLLVTVALRTPPPANRSPAPSRRRRGHLS